MSLTDSSPAQIANAASVASRNLAILPRADRNDALDAIHQSLLQAKESILNANARDLSLAIKAAEDGQLSQSVLKRLDLGRPGKWEDMLQGILDVRDLEDPLGKVTLKTLLDDGLILERIACPIGVLLIIFEARPEVIANIAALAIKSGNAAILKGGKESTASFHAISSAISAALTTTAVPNAAIQLVTTRDVIASLLECDKHIDLVIPRGSNELVRYVKASTRIPVLGHADGLCHIYIHADADPESCVRILLDSKLGYPAACNSVETLLIHQEALESHLPTIASQLLEKGCSLRCDSASKDSLLSSLPADKSALLQDAVEEDYDTEFLSPILAIKTVTAPDNADDGMALSLAVAHINAHSSHHTDAILTSSASVARQFQASVDSACVFWNTSTRMADGMRFGFGTEVGISTNKIHARGPVGLEGLCIYKYAVSGCGQVATDYGGSTGKKWKHERLGID
ncbi:glutamate-5-semialdehyde dehydrogenase [Xanthoria parietina]